MTILTDTLVEKGTIYETNSPTDQQINMTYNSQSYIYIHTHMTYSRDHRGITTNPPIDQQTNMTSKNRLNK